MHDKQMYFHSHHTNASNFQKKILSLIYKWHTQHIYYTYKLSTTLSSENISSLQMNINALTAKMSDAAIWIEILAFCNRTLYLVM